MIDVKARMAELRAEGRGTWEIQRIIKREQLELEIEEATSLREIKAVLLKVVERLG